MVKRILLALSGTPYTASATTHAVGLAKLHGASITGVTVTDLKRLAFTGSVPVGAIAAAHDLAEHRIQITEQRVEESIAAFRKACEEAGVACRVERETCDPLEELMNLWRYHDLTIFGLRGLFEYGVVHNPDDAVIRMLGHGVRPVVAVASEPRDVRKVLIAYNGSMNSAKAMKRFIQMRLWPEATARLVCFSDKIEEAEHLLADAADYCRAHDVNAETLRIDADAEKQLIPTAEAEGFDLIVLGSSSRKLLLKHVLGDTVLEAVRTSHVPLFLTQ